MGGNAFQNLPPRAFPRLSPLLYNLLKARLLPQLKQYYEHIAIPAEAPEKKDHGDLDFVVARPKSVEKEIGKAREVTHDDIKQSIGATFVIASRTTNFAVPITKEWLARDGVEYEDDIPSDVYCQVDVHLCADKGEWERVVFFHGFGDLGMIIGLIARNCGFTLGENGLKVPMQSGYPPFNISSLFPDILLFLGLSMDTWKQGFPTKLAAFEWAASSRFFDPSKLEDKENRSKRKEKAKRVMYIEFQTWAKKQPSPAAQPKWTQESALQEALVFFNKEIEYKTLVEEYASLEATYESKRRVKDIFNGALVSEWTGLEGLNVRKLMDRVREQNAGGEDMIGMTAEEVRKVVETAKVELGLTTKSNAVEKLTGQLNNLALENT